MKPFKLTLLSTIIFSSCAMAQHTSLRSGEQWPDNNGVHVNAHGGGMLYQKGTYYWFGEHKISGRGGNAAQVGVHCYSSKDLYNWKDEGIAFQVDTVNTTSEVAKGCVIERPKVVFNKKTGKYVMWFHLELKGKGYEAARAAVAVSDKVTGPYKYLHSFRPNAGRWPLNASASDTTEVAGGDASIANRPGKELAENGFFLRRDHKGGQMSRDMTIFQDDDGKAYLIGSAEENYTLNISELTPDYTNVTGKWSRIFPGGHNEAPALLKKDGKYFLITSGCTGWDPNAARSAVATAIWGPWKPLGNPCVGDDAHLTFHSQSTYIFPVAGKKDAFIFMADRWTPRNPIDGRYIWLPVQFEQGKPVLRWMDNWKLDFFHEKKTAPKTATGK